jgi:hypothetical protein
MYRDRKAGARAGEPQTAVENQEIEQEETPAAISPGNKVVDEKAVAEKPIKIKEPFKGLNQNQQESFMKSLTQLKLYRKREEQIIPSKFGAEIKKKDPVIDAKKLEVIAAEQTQKHLNVTKSKIEEKLKAKIFITDIEIVPLPSKPFVAQIVDLSLLTELNLLTIIEHSDDNTAFYGSIQEKVIADADLKNDPGFYIPEINEMVVAKFEGDFYRALCMDVDVNMRREYEVNLFCNM